MGCELCRFCGGGREDLHSSRGSNDENEIDGCLSDPSVNLIECPWRETFTEPDDAGSLETGFASWTVREGGGRNGDGWVLVC